MFVKLSAFCFIFPYAVLFLVSKMLILLLVLPLLVLTTRLGCLMSSSVLAVGKYARLFLFIFEILPDIDTH